MFPLPKWLWIFVSYSIIQGCSPGPYFHTFFLWLFHRWNFFTHCFLHDIKLVSARPWSPWGQDWVPPFLYLTDHNQKCGVQQMWEKIIKYLYKLTPSFRHQYHIQAYEKHVDLMIPQLSGKISNSFFAFNFSSEKCSFICDLQVMIEYIYKAQCNILRYAYTCSNHSK